MIELPDSIDVRTASARPTPDARRWFWSASQRRALAVMTLIAATALAINLARRPAVITDPPPAHPARFDELKDRLDPNTATAVELAVLPGVGPAKAQAIVAYRSTQTAPAFVQASDLTRVPGIGDITAEKLAPYLYFP